MGMHDERRRRQSQRHGGKDKEQRQSAVAGALRRVAVDEQQNDVSQDEGKHHRDGQNPGVG